MRTFETTLRTFAQTASNNGITAIVGKPAADALRDLYVRFLDHLLEKLQALCTTILPVDSVRIATCNSGSAIAATVVWQIPGLSLVQSMLLWLQQAMTRLRQVQLPVGGTQRDERSRGGNPPTANRQPLG